MAVTFATLSTASSIDLDGTNLGLVGGVAVIGLLAALYLAFAISGASNAEVWALLVGWVSSGFTIDLPHAAGLLVPFFKEVSYPLGVAGFVILSYLVIVGSAMPSI